MSRLLGIICIIVSVVLFFLVIFQQQKTNSFIILEVQMIHHENKYDIYFLKEKKDGCNIIIVDKPYTYTIGQRVKFIPD